MIIVSTAMLVVHSNKERVQISPAAFNWRLGIILLASDHSPAFDIPKGNVTAQLEVHLPIASHHILARDSWRAFLCAFSSHVLPTF